MLRARPQQLALGTCVTTLLPISPIARASTMVHDSEDSNLIAYDCIDQRVTKTPHKETTLAVTPNRAEARILEQQTDGATD